MKDIRLFSDAGTKAVDSNEGVGGVTSTTMQGIGFGSTGARLPSGWFKGVVVILDDNIRRLDSKRRRDSDDTIGVEWSWLQ